MSTYKTLVDLLIRVLDTETRNEQTAISAAIPQTINERLICSPELHIFLQILRQFLSWVPSGWIREAIKSYVMSYFFIFVSEVIFDERTVCVLLIIHEFNILA